MIVIESYISLLYYIYSNKFYSHQINAMEESTKGIQIPGSFSVWNPRMDLNIWGTYLLGFENRLLQVRAFVTGTEVHYLEGHKGVVSNTINRNNQHYYSIQWKPKLGT